MDAASLAKLQIMVVDDNTNMRRLIRLILESFGCTQIFDTPGAAAALEAFEVAEFDIVIVDYLMEPMDGLDLTRALRDPDLSSNPYVPVIMLTGAANMETVALARDAGVNEFLAKPVSAQSLYRRLHAIVERPRPFVRAKMFFGPDRRRRANPEYEGPERRDAEPRKTGAHHG